MECIGKGRAESVGAIVAGTAGAELAVGSRGCVHSAGAVLDASVGARSRECTIVVHAPESDTVRDSALGNMVAGEGNRETAGGLCSTIPSPMVIGGAGAALVAVVGAVSGGIRKVKSINSLLEALGSTEQRRVMKHPQLGLEVNQIEDAPRELK
ncbi:hypothetical protein V6N13_133471 [Hibiscus sabdariffa]|uniref:Uncharacterized protein n=1 Tax=Hibiscus sabdariffa TaxID=183260 RepID=A0ABR2CJ05_9ROSI